MTSRVFYVFRDETGISGGLRVTYRHVETLINNGYDAYVWLPKEDSNKPGQKWFNSPVRPIFEDKLELDNTDLMVVPQVFAQLAPVDPAPGCHKVIFNQGHFMTFLFGFDYPQWEPEPWMWVVSEESRSVMCHVQKQLPIIGLSYIPQVIDTDLFSPSDKQRKKVSWIPKKRPLDSTLLEAVFSADERFNDVETTLLDGLSERRIAAELGRTSVFVALGQTEGFGVPIAEALAAGCTVVGYPAGGGKELFKAPGTYPITDSDILSIVDQVAILLEQELTENERFLQREWIRERYSEMRQFRCLEKAIHDSLKQEGTGGWATHPAVIPLEPGGITVGNALHKCFQYPYPKSNFGLHLSSLTAKQRLGKGVDRGVGPTVMLDDTLER